MNFLKPDKDFDLFDDTLLRRPMASNTLKKFPLDFSKIALPEMPGLGFLVVVTKKVGKPDTFDKNLCYSFSVRSKSLPYTFVEYKVGFLAQKLILGGVSNDK